MAWYDLVEDEEDIEDVTEQEFDAMYERAQEAEQQKAYEARVDAERQAEYEQMVMERQVKQALHTRLAQAFKATIAAKQAEETPSAVVTMPVTTWPIRSNSSRPLIYNTGSSNTTNVTFYRSGVPVVMPLERVQEATALQLELDRLRAQNSALRALNAQYEEKK